MCLSILFSPPVSRAATTDTPMALLIDRRRVGVLGTQQAGKTTFLTTLVHHLRRHDPAEFPLGDGSWRVHFVTALDLDDGIPRFDFPRFRDQLQNRRWPDKTRAVSAYRCHLDFAGGPYLYRLENALSRTDLTLVDIPGERLADLGMSGTGYGPWSDLLLDLLEGQYAYLEECRPYLDLVEGGGPLTAAGAVVAYKRALARLAFAGLPVVTPSTLTVTPDGKYVPKEIVRTRDADALAAAHHAGLGPGLEFAPLPAAARAAHPAVAAEFERHYARYRDEVVGPLAAALFGCDQLVVLIDPTALLAGGVGAYNGCLHLLDVALKYLAPGRPGWAAGADAVVRFLTGGRGHLNDVLPTPSVRRLAFAVTQADRVHRDDRDKLEPLVRRMVEPILEPVLAAGGLDIGFFTCAAVDSSASRQYSTLEVLPLDEKNRPRSRTELVAVSPVPEVWPKDWAPGDFFYPRFAPIPPAKADHPPTQFGVNRVASFILGTA